MNNRKRIITLIILLILLILAGIDPRLQVTEYTYTNSKLPTAFDGYKICHISDLHCKSFGKNNESLIASIREIDPDILVLTGDIVDEVHSNLHAVEQLLAGLHELQIPTYYITGNHEVKDSAAEQYATFNVMMKKYNVTDLNDKVTALTRDGQNIYLSGSYWSYRSISNALPAPDPDAFNILLNHDANSFDVIDNYEYDLVLTGHIHGGIVRIPLLDIGLVGDGGTLFSKYTAGVYQNAVQSSTMIVSRGLGDSVFPRIFNRPELVQITLRAE